MTVFSKINPNATLTMTFQGLAICCFNANGADPANPARKGRWEIAVPRFGDHNFNMNIPGLGTVQVDPAVSLIEIKDTVGIAAPPTHPPTPGPNFDRKDTQNNDPNDFRWISNFTNNTEIPHGTVTPKTKAAFPNRVKVTMIYVYNSTLYTYIRRTFPLVLATQASSCPVVNGVIQPLPNSVVGAVLDPLNIWGFAPDSIGLDIQSPLGGTISIKFDGNTKTNLNQADGPFVMDIRNLEPNGPIPAGTIVKTNSNVHGLGDFYRYYELFTVTLAPFHLWERVRPAFLVSMSGDCNGTVVDLPNLDPLIG